MEEYMNGVDREKTYQCIACDYIHLAVICPNDDCKDYIHYYGSCNDVSNREEIRGSHCPADEGQCVKIRIDDTTARCVLTYYPNRSTTFSKRKFEAQRKIYEPTEEEVEERQKKILKTGKYIKKKGKFVVNFK